MLTEIAVSVSESPVFMVTDEDSWMLMLNVPAVTAFQNEMSVSTSPLVPAQDVHAGMLLELTLPPDGAFQVTFSRVVTDDTLPVPAVPGSPV